MKVSQRTSQPEMGAAAALILYMVLGPDHFGSWHVPTTYQLPANYRPTVLKEAVRDKPPNLSGL